MGIFDWARRVLGLKPAPVPPKKAVLTQAQVAATRGTTQPKPKNAVRIWRYCRGTGGRNIYCPHCYTKHAISSMSWSVKTCRQCHVKAGKREWLTIPTSLAEKMASADPAKEGTKRDTGGNKNG